MKKNYFFAALLILAFAVNSQAQDFIEIEGKDPAFHIKFDETVANFLKIEGSQFNNWEEFNGTWSTDTVYANPWGGSGDFNDFTMEDKIVSSDNFAELLLPAIFWDSYASLPTRPQGIAFYASTGVGGPRGKSARTVSFYVNLSDSARSDVGNGAWDNPYFYGLGNWAVNGERIYWYVDPVTMKFTLFLGGNVNNVTAENVIPKNEWVHLALTVAEGGARDDIKLWANGTVIPFADTTGTLDTINTTLEANWDGVRVGALVNMWMADFRIYDTELTQADFATLLGNNTSAPDLDHQNVFNIYPVPNKGIFTLELADNSRGEMLITNTIGQVVHRQLVDNKNIINVGNLPTGIYFISVSDEQNNLKVKKFLIE